MLSIVVVTLKNGISPMPSSTHVRQAVAQQINRISCRGYRGTVVDAGSGWGSLAFHLLKHCPDWSITGIENSPVPLYVSRLSAKLLLRLQPQASAVFLNRLCYTRGNIYSYPFERADVIVCYLYPGAMKRLSLIFADQLRPGAQIISICFALSGWQPEKIITCKDMYRTKIYVYTVSFEKII